MQFTSFEFLIFLPLVLLTYFWISPSRRWLLLLLASYFFYGFHNPSYVVLILLSTTIDFVTGLRIYENSYKKEKKRKWLFLSIFSNLGLLFFFKYFNFFGQEINALFNWFQIGYQLPQHQYLLPLGISFYTFQTLSYSVDVYRGYIKPETHFGKFALFVCFFPQLMAGPVERAKDLLKQFHFNYQFEYTRVVEGLQLILWGCFKKIIIADWFAIYVNEVYDVSNNHTGIVIMVATFLFGLQIFFDFSGYCDIAIGIARVLGIKLSQNFGNFIYFTSPSNFWRGWHITISDWFRDYLFYPLTQISKKKWFTHFCLLLTFLISGIWHGAGWGFIIWGLINGLLVIIDNQSQRFRSSFSQNTGLDKVPLFKKFIFSTISFVVLLFPTVFFRSPNIQEAFLLIRRAGDWSSSYLNLEIGNFKQVFILMLLCLIILFHIVLKKAQIYEFLSSKTFWFRWFFYVFLINSILFARPPFSTQFIYFEF